MRFAKHAICILLSAAILLAAACGREPAEPSTTAAPAIGPPPATQQYYTPTDAPETVASDGPELEPLEFDEEKAVYLGSFESEIFGRLTVYYQDLRIVIFDMDGRQRFTLYAQSYEPKYMGTPIELVADDVNFDGYMDFYLLYTKGNLNSYYSFWIWNMDKRIFEYSLVLSNIPSPQVDGYTKRIVSKNQTALDTMIFTTYVWAQGQIVPVAHEERTLDPANQYHDPFAPEIAGDSVYVQQDILLSTVILQMNDPTTSDWLCKIENERIVKLFGNTVDGASKTRRFTFVGVTPGTTTVILRYARGWNAPFLTQRVLNITVNRNRTLTITVTQ